MKLPRKLNSVCSTFSDFKEPWFVAGGWAIDLAVGRVTRQHSDVDICIFRNSLPQFFSYFKEWKIEVSIPGTSQRITCRSIEDVIIPRHELHCDFENINFEILLNETNGENIVFRRDTSIILPLERFTCWNNDNIPFVHPAWLLLYKAKYLKEKDQKDFKEVIKILLKDDLKWLHQALSRHQPGSHWLRELNELMYKRFN